MAEKKRKDSLKAKGPRQRIECFRYQTFLTFHKARKKKQTLSCLVGTTGYVIRAKFVTSLSRHLFGLFSYFKQQKAIFKKFYQLKYFIS